MAKTVRVACKLPMGIELPFFKMFDDGTGVPAGKHMVPTGERIILGGPAPRLDMLGEVVTEVDAEQFQRWLDQNPHHPFVASGDIRVLDDVEGRTVGAHDD